MDAWPSGPRRPRPARAPPAAPRAALALAAPARRRPRRRGAFATRPGGEPAWHRRARRERGQARTLLRIAAAQRLLQSHHSAQRHPQRSSLAMGRGGGGGGPRDGGSSVRDQLAQLLGRLDEEAAAFGGGIGKGGGRGGGARGYRAEAGGARGGGGGFGDNGGGGSGGAGRQRPMRAGDWACPECPFRPNFAFRTTCLRCGAARPTGGGGRPGQRTADSRRGPVGANGSRPLLSNFEARGAAARAGEPTYRKPGSSLAAPPARTANIGTGDSQARPGAANRPPAEHYVSGSVPQGGARDASGEAAACGETKPGEEVKVAASAVPRRGRWADSCPPCDRMAQDDDNSDYADEDAYAEEDEGEDEEAFGWNWQPTPEDLRRSWLQECRAVRALEHVERNCAEPSAALLAARGARDRAEQEWKDARDPKPVAVRMGWAQRKFDKAKRALDKQKDNLAEFEQATERRRTELQAKIDEAEARLQERQSQLDSLHREAGDLAASHPADRGGGYGGGEAEKIVGVMARELQAFIESLEEGSEARGKANELLAKVATASAKAEARQFDIATDPEEEEDETEARRASAGGSCISSTRRSPTWSENVHGRWDKNQQGAAASASTAAAGDPRRARQDAAKNGTPHSDNCGEGGAGSSRGRPSTRGRDELDDQPPSKFHRGHDMEVEVSVEASGDDAARAAKLQQEQQAAVEAAKEANATFGDEKSMLIAGQLYAHKVELVRARAQAVGIPPSSEGKQLIELQPDDLNRWVREVLAPAEKKKEKEDEL